MDEARRFSFDAARLVGRGICTGYSCNVMLRRASGTLPGAGSISHPARPAARTPNISRKWSRPAAASPMRRWRWSSSPYRRRARAFHGRRSAGSGAGRRMAGCLAGGRRRPAFAEVGSPRRRPPLALLPRRPWRRLRGIATATRSAALSHWRRRRATASRASSLWRWPTAGRHSNAA